MSASFSCAPSSTISKKIPEYRRMAVSIYPAADGDLQNRMLLCPRCTCFVKIMLSDGGLTECKFRNSGLPRDKLTS